MDKRKATLTLTEKLNGLGYINLVADSVIKAHLLNNAKSGVFDIPKSGRIRFLTSDNLPPVFLDKDIVKIDSLPYSWRNYKEANYFFLESSGSYLVTPVALIGEIEEKILKENFYKGVPEKMLKAFEVLKIPNFVEHYKNYLSLSKEEDAVLLQNHDVYIPFKEGVKVEVGDIIQGAQSKKYYLVEEVSSDGSVKGHKFEDVYLTTPVSNDSHDGCDFKNIIPVKKQVVDFNPLFLEFVFNLPDEDRNLVADKIVLKNLDSITSCDVLLKEYSKNKLFKEYFSALKKEAQDKVVEMVKSLPSQDKFLNSWLFSQGFDVKIDHIELYKKDTKGFITYFKRGSKELQELIVADLFNCEHINKEVIEFLEKEYSHLLRDVSFKNEISTSIKKDEQHYVSSSDEPKVTSRRGGGGLHKY